MADRRDNPSADELLEETRAKPAGPPDHQIKLSEDNDSPASSADRPELGRLSKGSPITDSRPNPGEVYEESEEGIAYAPTSPDLTTDEEDKRKFEKGEKL